MTVFNAANNARALVKSEGVRATLVGELRAALAEVGGRDSEGGKALAKKWKEAYMKAKSCDDAACRKAWSRYSATGEGEGTQSAADKAAKETAKAKRQGMSGQGKKGGGVITGAANMVGKGLPPSMTNAGDAASDVKRVAGELRIQYNTKAPLTKTLFESVNAILAEYADALAQLAKQEGAKKAA